MARVRELKNGKLSAEFDSVSDVFRVINKLNWEPKRDKASDRDRNSGYGRGFHVFKDLADATGVFLNRPETIRTFSANDDRLERPESPGKDVTFDVTGDYIDIGRFMSGEPEHFGNAVMGNPKNMFCTINVLTSYVSYTDARYLDQRQKRILRIVDWLETQGVRCQIIATSDTVCSFNSVTVKEFQDPFDLNQLAVVCHSDWLRRIIFLIDEQSKTWQSGYGNGTTYDNRMLKYKPQPEDGMYIYIGGYSPYKSVEILNKYFDKLEEKIADLVESGITWNEEPFTVGHRESPDDMGSWW